MRGGEIFVKEEEQLDATGHLKALNQVPISRVITITPI
jgi:hypothetical protein